MDISQILNEYGKQNNINPIDLEKLTTVFDTDPVLAELIKADGQEEVFDYIGGKMHCYLTPLAFLESDDQRKQFQCIDFWLMLHEFSLEDSRQLVLLSWLLSKFVEGLDSEDLGGLGILADTLDAIPKEDPGEEALIDMLWDCLPGEGEEVRPGIIPRSLREGLPKRITTTNTALINAMQNFDGKGEIIGDPEGIDIPVMNKNTAKEICIFVHVDYEGVEIAKKYLPEYDRRVFDAVISFYKDRTDKGLAPIFTPEMIYRAMNGKASKSGVGKKNKQRIVESLEKLRRLFIDADVTEQVQAMKTTINGEAVEKYIISDYMLPLKMEYVQTKNKEYMAYTVISKPQLLTYAELTKQIYSVNTKLMDIKKVDKKTGEVLTTSVLNNDYRIATKSYLSRRIEVMKSDEQKARDKHRKYLNRCKRQKVAPIYNIEHFRKQKRIILFEKIFIAAEVTSPDTKTEIREYVFAVLDFWGTVPVHEGGVRGYSRRKKGKSFDAVEIII